jgi:hypothetical protein
MNHIINPIFPVPNAPVAPLLYRQCGNIMKAKIENIIYIINVLPHNNGCEYIAIERVDKEPFKSCMLHYNNDTMKWCLPTLYV